MIGMELMLSALCLSCNLSGEYTGDRILLDDDGKPQPQEENGLMPRAMVLREWINGRHLRIGTLDDYPLSYTEMVNGKLMGRGVSFTLIDFLQKKFNFTYEVVLPQKNIIGSPSNDFDDSLIEMLTKSQVDLAAAFIPFLNKLRTSILHSTTILDEGEWIIVMERTRGGTDGTGLMAPFEFEVWIAILISLLAIGPIMYMLINLRNKLTSDDEEKPYTLGHCAWFVYSALMKQGTTLTPLGHSTRMLFATWWMFITILTSFYTANLTAFLTLSKFTLPYNSAEQILYKSKNFVSTRGGGIEYAIRNTKAFDKMIEKKYVIFSNDHNDTRNLHHYVGEKGYIFVRDRPAINHVLNKDYFYRTGINNIEKAHCPFAMAKEPFLKMPRSFAYPIGSVLSELFDPVLQNLVEFGIIKHHTTKDLPTADICPQHLRTTERQLWNSDFMLTYYIVCSGFVTALVVFFTEIAFRLKNDHPEANQWARHGIGRTLMANFGSHEQCSTVSPNTDVVPPSPPPPPYKSIFNGNSTIRNYRRQSASNTSFGSVGSQCGDDVLLGVGGGSAGANQSPAETGGVRRLINGHYYMVFRNSNGQRNLVPMHAPTAESLEHNYIE